MKKKTMIIAVIVAGLTMNVTAEEAAPETRPGEETALHLGGGVKMELAWIPAGSFMMGSPNNEKARMDDEGPAHRVTITKGFWMGKYEVTQEQYEQVTGKNPSRFKVGRNPVEQVSWNDAKAFCETVSKKTGKTVRLPTEAEWEYACRAGTTTRFYTGDNESDLSEAGWWWGNSGRTTHPVGEKKPNAWELYDMHGNVWEWCGDWYEVYPSGSVTDPRGPASGSYRVLRGGSWYHFASYGRVAFRASYNPAHISDNMGFRAVLSPGQ